MFKLLKIVIKQLLCHHRYQPYNYASCVDIKGRLSDTDYIFNCIKCGHEKVIETYGEDLILNTHKK